MPPLPKDFPSRVRAARAYAGIGSQKELGQRIGLSGTTVKNYESGKHGPDERASGETIRRLAATTKLPEWFFTVGSLHNLGLGAGATPVEERLAEIERQLAHLVEAIDAQPGPLRPSARPTVESLFDRMTSLTRDLQEFVNQQGRHIGRRDLQRQSDRIRPPVEGVA